MSDKTLQKTLQYRAEIEYCQQCLFDCNGGVTFESDFDNNIIHLSEAKYLLLHQKKRSIELGSALFFNEDLLTIVNRKLKKYGGINSRY